jgi:hypothetical protein
VSGQEVGSECVLLWLRLWRLRGHPDISCDPQYRLRLGCYILAFLTACRRERFHAAGHGWLQAARQLVGHSVVSLRRQNLDLAGGIAYAGRGVPLDVY